MTYDTTSYFFKRFSLFIILGILSTAILFFIIYYASKLPIYPDEVAYKIFLERFFINGGFKQSLTPYCESGFMVEPSIFLWPAAALWSTLTFLGSGWASYRLLPISLLLFTIFYLVFQSYRNSGSVPWISILLLAVSPWVYGLIILRPEIFILSFGLLIFILCVYILRLKNPLFLYIYSSIIIFIYSLILYIHPKTLYLLPLILFGLLFGSMNLKGFIKTSFYNLVFCCTALTVSISALNLHKKQYLTCPEVPSIQLTMNSQALNLTKLFEDEKVFSENFNKLFGDEITNRTLSQFNFKNTYDINYLPPKDLLDSADIAINRFNKLILIFEILILMLSLIFSLKFIPLKNSILLGSFSTGLLLSSFLSYSRNWYDISMFMGAIMVSIGLYYPYYYPLIKSKFKGIYKFLYLYTFLVAIAAICTLLLISDNFNRSFTRGYAGPGISLSVDRSSLKHSVNKILTKYNLVDKNSIIVDDLTYEYLKYRFKVIPASYLGLLAGKPDLINDTLRREAVGYGLVRCGTFTFLMSSFPNLNWIIIDTILDKSSFENLCLFSTP